MNKSQALTYLQNLANSKNLLPKDSFQINLLAETLLYRKNPLLPWHEKEIKRFLDLYSQNTTEDRQEQEQKDNQNPPCPF